MNGAGGFTWMTSASREATVATFTRAMGVDTATVDAGRVEGATGRGAGWEARVGAGAAAGAGARTGAGAAACGATRAGALTAGGGGSGAMGAGAGCEGRPSGAGDRLGGGGGAVGGWKPIMVGLCARATGRAEGRSGELTGAASSAGGGVEPTFTSGAMEAAGGGCEGGVEGAGTIDGRTLGAPPSTSEGSVATRLVSSSSSACDTSRASLRASSNVVAPSCSAAASTFMRNTCADA